MICPRCDKQGLIYKVKILNVGINLYICDECDACWPIDQLIDLKNFKDLEIFLKEYNLTYEATQIEDLGYIEPSQRERVYFNVERDELISLIDEAWLMKGDPLPYDPGAYIIDMKRIVGEQGESGIK